MERENRKVKKKERKIKKLKESKKKRIGVWLKSIMQTRKHAHK